MLICGGFFADVFNPRFSGPADALYRGCLIGFGLYQRRSIKKKAEVPAAEEKKGERRRKRKPENVLSLLQVEQLELEFGYGIVPMVDVSLGEDLLDRIIMIRRQCAMIWALSCRRSGCATTCG